MPQSQITEQPTAPRGIDTVHLQTNDSINTTNKHSALFFSHTRSGFPLFLPMWDISLSHNIQCTSPKESKIKKKILTLTTIRDVIEMLKWRHHVAYQRIQDFLEVFFTFFFQMRYLVVSKKNNPLFVWGWDRKNPSLRTTVCHHKALWCLSVIRGTIFYIPPSHSWWILIFSARWLKKR